MGITMRQEIMGIADAYEQQELQIRALQNALLDQIRRENVCYPEACKAFKDHPRPWHAEHCGCALEARDLAIDHRRAIEAKEKA